MSGVEEFAEDEGWDDDWGEEDLEVATTGEADALLAAIEGRGPAQEPEPASGAVTELRFVAPSFEEFIVRFFLENELWYARAYEEEMTDDLHAYLAALR